MQCSPGCLLLCAVWYRWRSSSSERGGGKCRSEQRPGSWKRTRRAPALDRSFADCAGARLKAILNHSIQGTESLPAKQLLERVKGVSQSGAPLLRRFLKNTDDGVEVLLTERRSAWSVDRRLAPLFQHVLQGLYDSDCVSEEAVLAWADEKKGAEAEDKVFVKQSEKFIQWLQEAEEDDEDDEDE